MLGARYENVKNGSHKKGNKDYIAKYVQAPRLSTPRGKGCTP